MNEQLSKLNAYLISKGRPPRSATGVNFVKKNIGNIQKNKTPIRDRILKSSTPNKSQTQQEKVRTSAKTIKKTCKMESSSTLKHVDVKTQGPKTPRLKENNIQTKKPKPATSGNPKHMKKEEKTPKSTHLKPQLRCQTQGRATKIASQVKKDLGATATPLCARKKIMCKSAGPHLKSKARIQGNTKPHNKFIEDEQLKLYQKLNNWLISKGKKPLEGKMLRGFKPTKTIATPVGSPFRASKHTTTGSHWQGLREEDADDEITVLIRHTMSDVETCLNEGCSPKILTEMLKDLAEKLPTAKSQAKYWLMLVEVEKQAGKSDDVILDIYKNAVLANAQPIEEIKEALQRMLLLRVEPAKGEKNSEKILNETSRKRRRTYEAEECEELFSPVPPKQCNTPNPRLERFIRAETPLLKNAATSPIIFNSPTGVTPISSPSSVVKLRIISKSSPVFNRMKSIRALPDEASAIVTPVRRSRRIADAQENYPKSLQDHDPCLTTIREILPVIGDSSKQENPNTTACDVVFDPNSALGEEFSDIATVWKF